MEIELWMQYVVYALLLLLIWLGIRFLWISITQRIHQPEQWAHHARNHKIPSEIMKAEKSDHDKVRLYNFWFQASRIIGQDIRGDFAELGVYRGDSAFLIHHLAPGRKLHLFDTFSGFFEPDLSMESGEAASYSRDDFADTDTGTVRARIGDSSGIIFHEGYFPDTAKEVEDVQFALVHIDADLYLPVKAGLEFFYPRLAPGGVIMVHDYTWKWEGLSRAVDEFLQTIPESLVHVPDRFGTVMIIRNKQGA